VLVLSQPISVLTVGLALATAAWGQATGSVIFIHPDGTSAATWAAARALYVGPDEDLNWDKLPHIGVYRGHMADCLTATSNGGATTHATGVKVASDAFGMTAAGDRGQRILDANGRYLSVAIQALDRGIPVGVVQSGTAVEPGTAIFLTDAPRRSDHDVIALGLIESGAQVILGGGEKHFLPKDAKGVHGPGARRDDKDLVELARERGYTVVFTRQELLNLPESTEKVLGLFASYHTFNDLSEEELAASKLPMYWPDAPTVAEMTDWALRRLSRDGRQFLLVVEEEGTDNFGNHNNAAGMLEAMRRGDEAIGVAREFLSKHPDTLLVTTADSDAGGMRMVGLPVALNAESPPTIPARDFNGAPQDGVNGAGTAPFIAAPDRAGRRLPFGVVWAAQDDVSGGILVRAEGLNAELVRGSVDNTRIPALIRRTLFGEENPNVGQASGER
jgi:alkaline phosphatase